MRIRITDETAAGWLCLLFATAAAFVGCPRASADDSDARAALALAAASPGAAPRQLPAVSVSPPPGVPAAVPPWGGAPAGPFVPNPGWSAPVAVGATRAIAGPNVGGGGRFDPGPWDSTASGGACAGGQCGAPARGLLRRR